MNFKSGDAISLIGKVLSNVKNLIFVFLVLFSCFVFCFLVCLLVFFRIYLVES